jgi:hypothetical protein
MYFTNNKKNDKPKYFGREIEELVAEEGNEFENIPMLIYISINSILETEKIFEGFNIF